MVNEKEKEKIENEVARMVVEGSVELRKKELSDEEVKDFTEKIEKEVDKGFLKVDKRGKLDVNEEYEWW